MKNRLVLLPVLLASVAMAFVMYRTVTFAEGSPGEEFAVADSAQSVYEDQARGDAGAAAAQYSIPDDIYYTKNVSSVVFSHQAHVAGQGLSCGSCHGGIFQMKANSVESKPDFNMKGLSDGKYCGSCHSSGNKAAFASDTQCARCHSGVKGLQREEQVKNNS